MKSFVSFNLHTLLPICLAFTNPLRSLTVDQLQDSNYLNLARSEIENCDRYPFDAQGWCANTRQLQAIIRRYSPSIIVEVGSWKGLSAHQMSLAAPPTTLIFCVDHWLGSEEHQPGGSAFLPGLDHLYQTFLNNCRHRGLAGRIIPVRSDSLAAAERFPGKADMIYIDAAHDTKSVYADIKAWTPVLTEDGVLCGDDWSWPTVRKAVEQFAAETGLTIYSEGNFWSFTPIPAGTKTPPQPPSKRRPRQR